MPRWRWIALLGFVPLLTGCFAFRSLPPEVERPLWRPTDEIPPEQKNCVYTFVFGTLDFLDAGQTDALRGHLIEMGFVKTYHGQSHHLSYFATKLREIAAHCPEAKFAIIGYSTGASSAAELAIEARKADIPVELLLFLEPAATCRSCDDTLAGHVMTIRGDGGIFGCTPTTCGELALIENAHRSAVPTHEVTMEILERELMLIAFGVSLPPRIDHPKKPLVEPFPPPRQTPRHVKPLPAEWRFLQPYGGLGAEVKVVEELPPSPGEKLPAPREANP